MILQSKMNSQNEIYNYDEVKNEIEFNYTVEELEDELKQKFEYSLKTKEVVKFKNCDICGVLKTLPQFYKSITRKDGYKTTCRVCSTKQSRIRALNFELDQLNNKVRKSLSSKQKYIRNKNKTILTEEHFINEITNEFEKVIQQK